MRDFNYPLITAVVPVYNGENYLEECINSILNQDYKNIEVIIVNDGSKDNSKKIAEKLSKKDKRVKIINQENSGVSTARNAGIEKAQGEYITFVDVDDYVSKEYLTYFYNLISENNADIALTPQPVKFKASIKDIKVPIVEDKVELWTGIKAAQEMLYYNIVIAPWNKLISMKLINKHNLRFNTKLSFGEGFNFSVDCFQRAKRVVVGKKKVYYYRVDNPNSVMTKFSERLVLGSIESQQTIKENLVNPTSELLKACKYANWHTHFDCLNTIIGSESTKKYPETYKELKKITRRDALCSISAPISTKEKIKGLMYFISPVATSKIINHFRIRKFTK